MQKKYLVIGGSGMLSDACLWLANQGIKTTVIGRNENKLNRLIQKNELIVPLIADYKDQKSFEETIRSYVSRHGIFSSIIAWIHNKEEEILKIALHSNGGEADSIFHVLGSSSDVNSIRTKINFKASINYLQIQLGYKRESNRSRWLTDDEISGGVIKAIKTNQDVLVGQLEPWSERP